MGTARRRGCGMYSPEALRLAQKDRAAVLMRYEGHTLDEIARTLGYSNRSGAYKAVARGLALAPSVGREFERALVWLGLDELSYAVWSALDDREIPFRAGVETLLAILDIRMKLTADAKLPYYRPSRTRRRDGAAPEFSQVVADATAWGRYCDARFAGKTFAEIAEVERLPNPACARRRVAADLQSWMGSAADLLRDHMGAELDRLQSELWDDATGSQPDLESVRVVLKIIKQRCRLLGLYQTIPKTRHRKVTAGAYNARRHR